MDVLLINSINFSFSDTINLGLQSIATLLKENGINVCLTDVDALLISKSIESDENIEKTMDNITRYILSRNPKVVGFYTMCNSYPYILKIAELLKIRNPKLKIILGGPQATITAYETLKLFRFIDVIGMGEAETYILSLIKALIYDKTLGEIAGIAYRDNNGIKLNKNASLIRNLDELPFIDINILGEEYYKDKCELDAGRGCPYSCTYCATSIFWRRCFRLKSNGRIIKEIKKLKTERGAEYFKFTHDMFTANKERVISFCRQLSDENLDISWRCSARVDSLDEEMIKIMSASGCRSMFLGIESASEKIQTVINKKIDLSKAMDTIKLLTKYNINCEVSLIYGFYEETVDDLRKTLQFIIELLDNGVCEIQLNRLTVMSGTEEYEKLKDKLYIKNDTINYSINGTAGLYIQYFLPLLKSNKKIFSNFYDFSTMVRDKYKRLDVFISFLSTMYAKFRYTIRNILLMFNDDLILFYARYSYLCDKIIYDFQYKSGYGNSNSTEPDTIYKKYMNIIFYDVWNKEKNKGNRELMMVMFDFENDIYDFVNKSTEENKVTEYGYDVVKLSENRKIDHDAVKQPIAVKFTRIYEKKIRVDRIA